MKLEKILGAKNNIKIIKHLIKHQDWEFNITELAKDTGMNKGVLSRLIPVLEKENILKVKRKGKILLIAINKSHLLMKKLIIPLFLQNESIVIEDLRSKLPKLGDCGTLSFILYGSYASETATLASDIDLMIVVKKQNILLDKKMSMVKEYFLANDIMLRVDSISIAEFKKVYNQGEPLLKSIMKNHKILFGKSVDELI